MTVKLVSKLQIESELSSVYDYLDGIDDAQSVSRRLLQLNLAASHLVEVNSGLLEWIFHLLERINRLQDQVTNASMEQDKNQQLIALLNERLEGHLEEI